MQICPSFTQQNYWFAKFLPRQNIALYVQYVFSVYLHMHFILSSHYQTTFQASVMCVYDMYMHDGNQ